jgi:hypothetical protein
VLLNEPDPDVVQVTVLAPPPITPANVCVDPAQMIASIPAFAVGIGLIVRIIASVTGPHGPAGSFVVNVIVTEPAVTSAADGVYTAVADVLLLNVPVPDVVHVNVDAPPPTAPFKVYVLPEHIVASAPAFAVAAGFIVSSI